MSKAEDARAFAKSLLSLMQQVEELDAQTPKNAYQKQVIGRAITNLYPGTDEAKSQQVAEELDGNITDKDMAYNGWTKSPEGLRNVQYEVRTVLYKHGLLNMEDDVQENKTLEKLYEQIEKNYASA
jgi:hypothetical protein